jgi:hypothetical protein
MVLTFVVMLVPMTFKHATSKEAHGKAEIKVEVLPLKPVPAVSVVATNVWRFLPGEMIHAIKRTSDPTNERWIGEYPKAHYACDLTLTEPVNGDLSSAMGSTASPDETLCACDHWKKSAQLYANVSTTGVLVRRWYERCGPGNAGWHRIETGIKENQMSKFALLLHHVPDRYTSLNEDDFMAVMKDYIAWVEQATADGIYLGGYKLAGRPGKTVTANGRVVEVHEGPFAELAEILGGVMFVEVADLDAAIELAKHHPHLVHNSKIEIRQIEGED